MSDPVRVGYVTQVSPLQVARMPGGVGVDAAGSLVAGLVVGDKVLVSTGRALWVLGKVV